jgi:hypothetical protein
MKIKTINRNLGLTAGLALLSTTATAGHTISTGEDSSITFGGYIAADVKHVSGDLAPFLNDFWIGNAAVSDDLSLTKMSISSSRLNTKYVTGDTSAFVELDFYTDEGNEILTNSRGPRVRHAFIKHGNWTFGQTWSTFMNTSAIADSVDFGGPLVATAFVRQTQIRYTNGAFQFAIENPESYGGDNKQDAMPDFVGKYTFTGDWGNVSVSAVARQVNTVGGDSDTAVGFGLAGKIKVGDKDDLRFQVHGGSSGRYVGAAASPDLAGEEVENATSIMVSYRHIWNDTYRSNVYYGNTTTDTTDRDRTHWGVNLFKNVTPKLSYGFEVGNYEAAEIDKNSNYLQFMAKYVL